MKGKKAISRLDTAVKNIFGYVGILMILIETYSVFARNVLKIPSPWTDETLKLLFVWSIFICAGLAFLGDELIGLDLLGEKISGNRKAYGSLKLVQYVMGLIMGGFSTFWGFQIILTQIATNERTAVVKYPLWVINMGFLGGSIMIMVFALKKLYGCRGYFKGDGQGPSTE